MTVTPRWVVIPAEMNILGGRPSAKGEVARTVESLLCVGWDDETARPPAGPAPSETTTR